MQLDSHLVERFHALHRQRMTGVLQAKGEGFSLGICLAEGDPVAIDLGIDIEQAFAEACVAYHKLDESGMAELSAAIAGGAKAREYLVERQLVSDAEADQLSQAVVEDSLTRAFRGPVVSIDFQEGVTPDQLPIGRSALKMRIGVEALIRTCDQRVGEQLAVEREVGGWDAVFSMSEGEHVSGALSEYEKMVLNFIDGRSTVQQIAELCRDSSLNLGRVMRSLIAKRVIHRLEQRNSGGSSGMNPAVKSPSTTVVRNGPKSGVTVATVNSPAVATASVPTPVDIEPYYRSPRRESGNRPIVLVGLLALLAICLGVALLVVQYNRKQERLRKDQNEVSQLITGRSWTDVRNLVAKLRQEAGNDLSAIRTVDGLGAQVEAAITAERTAIGELIEGEEFVAARPRVAVLPDETVLAAKLRDAEADVRASASALGDEVRARLANGDVAGALAAIDEVKGQRALEGNRALTTWRADTQVAARSQPLPLSVRLSAVAKLRQARPDAALEGQLAALDAELQAQIKVVADRLVVLEASASSGAWREVQAEMKGMRLGDLGAGTAIEAAADKTASAAKRTAAAVEAVVDPGLEALSAGAGAETLDPARAKIATMLQQYAQVSDRDSIERLVGAMAASSGSDTRTVAERAAESKALGAQIAAKDVRLVEALNARSLSLQAIEASARVSLEEARRLGRDGDWNAAVSALEVIVKQPKWQLTAVRKEADIDLDAARGKAVRRAQLKDELKIALLKGDVAACEAIGREIGLAYLPLVVMSQPEGAEVVNAEGKVLGVTPLIHEVTADVRIDMRLIVRKTGYKDASVSGAAADGGWRIKVRLDRSATLAQDSGRPLTVRPAVINGELWLGDRGRVITYAKPTADASRTVAIDSTSPLVEPVLAAVAQVGDELMLATRERLAIRLPSNERIALPAGSDFPLLSYRSPLVIGRDLLIVATSDGRLLGAQRGTAVLTWQTAGSSLYAAEAVLIGEHILTVRRDGRLESTRAEDGGIENVAKLDGPVLAAWPTATGLAGLTAARSFAWDGLKMTGEDLPEPCVGGGPGVIVGTFGKIMLRGDGGWVEVGKLDAKPEANDRMSALAWGGHAVIANGAVLSVFGPKPFRIDAGSEVLPPVVWNGSLVAASLEGKLWIWAE